MNSCRLAQGPNGSIATVDILNGSAPSTSTPGSGGAAAVNVGNASQGPNGSLATIDVGNGAGTTITGTPGGGGNGGTDSGGGSSSVKIGGVLYDLATAGDLAEALGPQCVRVLKDPQQYSRRLWKHCHWMADHWAKRHHQAAK